MKTIALTQDSSLSNQPNFSCRIESLLRERGTSKAWLANKLNISRQALNQVLNHSKKPKYVSEISIIFNINPQWLLTGEGNIDITGSDEPIPSLSLFTIEDGKLIKSKIDESVVPYSTGKHDAFFAVKVKNIASIEPRFPAGSILIFEKCQPNNHEFVICKVDNKILVRRYIEENKKIILTPCNDSFSIIKCTTTQYTHIGTLVETRLIYKK